MESEVLFDGTMPRTFNGRTRYTDADHVTWATLHKRQTALIWAHVCTMYKEGTMLLRLPHRKVPQLLDTMPTITAQTGWKLAPAEAAYLSDEQWFTHFQNKRFPVTNYLRAPHEVDFTPQPDMFHDYFGHLPFMVFAEYAEFAALFGEAYRVTPAEHKHELARVWWHTFEFGLIKEDGEIRLLGAGLISSKEECINALDPARHEPFDFYASMKKPKSDQNVHQKYYVLESLEELREALVAYILKHNGTGGI